MSEALIRLHVESLLRLLSIEVNVPDPTLAHWSPLLPAMIVFTYARVPLPE
jgi:hypothetical protein